MYILVFTDSVIECNTLEEIGSYFDIRITKDGKVLYNGEVQSISYKIDEWSEPEIYRDFIKHTLSKFVPIYKAERL